MVSPSRFHNVLTDAGVDFYTGVPDSLLKELGAYLDAVLPPHQHLIAASEGAALAVATGYHLASGTTPLVYLQNSGLGNLVNPLLSLADPEVYAIPMVLLVGWRGEPGVKDEPQHVKQGRVTPDLLNAMEIPFDVIGPDQDDGVIAEITKEAVATACRTSRPVALLVRKGAFEKSDRYRQFPVQYSMSREEAIERIVDVLPSSATIVSTTGKTSRELYEIRDAKMSSHSSDFLTVGSMGHASQIALGIAIASPTAPVVCLDGDGAAIMQMGGLTSIAAVAPSNFIHIILNNGAHESVGGQPTAGFVADLSSVARAAGYRNVPARVESGKFLKDAILRLVEVDGPSLLEVRIAVGSRPDLGRPKVTPAENKELFMDRLRRGKL